MTASTTQWPVRRAARERSRTALLEAAAELGLTGGYAGTSLEAVAARAGVTTGAIYSIFGSKLALFEQVVAERYDDVRFTEVVPPGTPMRDGLRAFGIAWARRYSNDEAKAAFGIALEILLLIRADPALSRKMVEDTVPARQALADDLELRARQAGESAPLPFLDLAIALHSCMTGLMAERLHTGSPPDAVFGHVAASLWGAGKSREDA